MDIFELWSLYFMKGLIFYYYDVGDGDLLFTRQDILGQYSMVNLELFNIVDEIKKVSKAFVVHPKNVNAENATSMLSFP